jgi:hypothetical protein
MGFSLKNMFGMLGLSSSVHVAHIAYASGMTAYLLTDGVFGTGGCHLAGFDLLPKQKMAEVMCP